MFTVNAKHNGMKGEEELVFVQYMKCTKLMANAGNDLGVFS